MDEKYLDAPILRIRASAYKALKRIIVHTTKPAPHTFGAVCDGLALSAAQQRRHQGYAAVHAAAEQRQVGRLECQASAVGLDEDGPRTLAQIPTSYPRNSG